MKNNISVKSHSGVEKQRPRQKPYADNKSAYNVDIFTALSSKPNLSFARTILLAKAIRELKNNVTDKNCMTVNQSAYGKDVFTALLSKPKLLRVKRRYPGQKLSGGRWVLLLTSAIKYTVFI